MVDNSQRFTDTVEHYLRYRPSYPHEILERFIQSGLTKSSIIADLGSGTGFLSKLFLDYGCTVIGVEPNEAMRAAAQQYLKSYSSFTQIAGYAEDTTLQNSSVDFITVGTAFHWFDAIKTKIEFQRILKSNGWVFLIWNVRDIEHSELMNDYENLILKYGKNYKNSRAQEFEKTAVEQFFAPNKMHSASYPYKQLFDWQGFKGRLLSTSYTLRENDPSFDDMMKELKIIFDRYQKENQIEFLYQTKMYYGQITVTESCSSRKDG